jgi:hypothetical protein
MARSASEPEARTANPARTDAGRVPLTVEGYPRTLSGPSPDLSPTRTLAHSSSTSAARVAYRALRKSSTRLVRSAVASGSYDGSELSAK